MAVIVYGGFTCPAVSQSCSLTVVPSLTLKSLAKKSTPTVGSDTSAKVPSVKFLRSELLPTVESPMRMTRNWKSKIGSTIVELRSYSGGDGGEKTWLGPVFLPEENNKDMKMYFKESSNGMNLRTEFFLCVIVRVEVKTKRVFVFRNVLTRKTCKLNWRVFSSWKISTF